MLVEFSVENFLSFKEKTTFSMVAAPIENRAEETKGNVIFSAQGTKYDLLKSAVIFGSNASGKSNLLSAITFFKNFILNSFKVKPDTHIPAQPFKLDQVCLTMPGALEATLLKDGVPYRYGFSFDNNEVNKEWLFSYPKGQKRLVFERDSASSNTVRFGSGFNVPKNTQETYRSAIQKRGNSLFISLLSQFSNPEADIITSWAGTLQTLDFFKAPTSTALLNETMEFAEQDSAFKEFSMRFIKCADTGISDYRVEKEQRPQHFNDMVEQLASAFIDKLVSEEKKKQISSSLKNQAYFEFKIITRHKTMDNEDFNPPDFSADEESDGTIKLFSLAYPIYKMMTENQIYIIDEMDLGLHSLLSRWMINLIHKNRNDSGGGQLIFATHNTELLKDNLFRRDQIWFTEKNPHSGATDLYSLSDIRKTRSVENHRRMYLEGLYGAIPLLGELKI